ALLRRLGQAAHAGLRRALQTALGLLPELLRGGLPRAADRRRGGALREPGVPVSTAGADAREPLLLIHGLGASASVWDPVVPLLSAERDVVVLDMPGFGRAASLPPGVEPTAAALAGALRDEL